MTRQYVVEEDGSGVRIDRYLAQADQSLSRSYLQKLLKNGEVLADGLPVKPNYKLAAGVTIEFELPEAAEPEITAREMPLDIIYEHEDVLLVNKPKGMVVHPAAGHTDDTLVNGLMAHCAGQLSGINGVMRPGIVHRIDRDTTGLLIVCKNDLAHNSIAGQLKEHTITRRYQTIVCGVMRDDEGLIDAPIGRHPTERKKMAVNVKNGRRAVTHYRVLERFRDYTYLECRLETGRTHQIRVHMSSIHHPVLGDSVYGPAKCPFSLEGQTLHAGVLGFIHPRTGEYMEFQAPLPDYFVNLLEKLRKMT